MLDYPRGFGVTTVEIMPGSTLQLPAPLRDESAEEGQVITGRIVDTRGQPVLGALVGSYLWQPPGSGFAGDDFSNGPTVDTDALGRFRLPKVHRSRLILSVLAAGYLERSDLFVHTGSGKEKDIGDVVLVPSLQAQLWPLPAELMYLTKNAPPPPSWPEFEIESSPAGAAIKELSPWSSASLRLKPQDIITAINGTSLRGMNKLDMEALLMAPGAKVLRVQTLENGASREVSFSPAETRHAPIAADVVLKHVL